MFFGESQMGSVKLLLMLRDKLILDGGSLKIKDVIWWLGNENARLDISSHSLSLVRRSWNFLVQESGKRIVYGVNTGFGPMATHVINGDKLQLLQENLIRSHAVGVGEMINADYILASMIIRINTLAKGFSGVSVELIEHFKNIINHRIIPIVPEHGAVGTSGDLVQLAHIASALMGEGEVVYKGNKESAKDLLERLYIKPYKLKPKEGLALINGTSLMSGIACVLSRDSSRLISLATRTAAFALELVEGFEDGISEKLHSLRPHWGQLCIAKEMRALLQTSRLLRKRDNLRQDNFDNGKENNKHIFKIPEVVQEYYSIRCAAQVLGPVLDTFLNTYQVFETEINSVTDNPIVDAENKDFLHGGNFHGDYIASALDQLKMTLVKLTMLSERRLNFFLHKQINQYLPPFLNLHTPGLTLALQGLQFVATSTTAQSQTLAFPQYVHSIPTNADNMDIVSMGADAALLTAKVVENAYIVLAIELIVLAQAVDFLKVENVTSKHSRRLYESVRSIFPKVYADRLMSSEVNMLVEHIKTSADFDIEWTHRNFFVSNE